jgi:peptidoglycan/LPS O-acetylase OafA/YrhL
MSDTKKVAGIDALRFVMAAWVVMGHFSPFPLPDTFGLRGPARLLRGFLGNCFSGPAAVIVFFIISGFCIHYPYRKALRIDLVSFYARRQVRIGIPVVIAIALAVPLHIELWKLNASILWSLVCEEVYYAIYPALFAMQRRVGWSVLIAVSYAVSLTLVATMGRHAGNYPSFGMANWVLGLPCWLLGARMAHRADELVAAEEALGPTKVWSWRAGTWALSWVCSALRFHSPIGYPWTLNPFALFASFWLRREIINAARVGAGPLERWGVLSYSLYLVHVHAYAIWKLVGIGLPEPADTAVLYALVLAVSSAFYRLVEKPSHVLARRIHLRVVEMTS